MSRYKPYPAYKDSGVEWLGEVPRNWAVTALKRGFRVSGGSTPKSDHEAYWDGSFIWVTPADLSKLSTFEIADSQRKITAEGLASCGTTLVPVGSIVLSTRAPIGSLAIADRVLCTNQGCKALVPTEHVYSRFYAYLLSIATEELNIRGKGTTFLELSGDELSGFSVVLPIVDEQHTVATFLDRETAKLDTLIAKQEKLIELLQEKRQALISHAVTKGLNPDAPMKDSGVAWLGEVPAHWEVTPIKHIVSVPVTDGPHETPEFFDEGVPFVSAEAVSTGKIDFEKIRGFISAEDHRRYSLKYSPRIHDIYMVKSGATTGVSAIVETDLEFNIWSPLAVIRCGDAANPYFILNVIRSRNFQEAIALNWSFGTQQNIGMGVIQNLPVPIPPLEEQAEIASYLGAESNKLDTLIEKSRHSIELMREHRTALISAAVTGKIDIRAQHQAAA